MPTKKNKVHLSKRMQQVLKDLKKSNGRIRNPKYNSSTVRALESRGLVSVCPLHGDLLSLDNPPRDIFISYTKSSYGGNVREGQEDQSYPNYEDTHSETSIQGIFSKRDKHSHSWDSYCDNLDCSFEPKPGMNVWLVSVNYDTGSTFGRTLGLTCFVGVYDSEEEAEEVASAIASDQYRGYAAWKGYFDHYNFTEIEKFVVDEKPPKRRL